MSKGQTVVALAMISALVFAPLSRVLVSISIAIAGFGFLNRIAEGSLKRTHLLNSATWPLWLYVLLQFTGFLLHGFPPQWMESVLLVLPLLILPLALSGLSLELPVIRRGFYVTGLVFTAIALHSSINYFQHREIIDQLLLESKHVPLSTGMHHIYFGLFQAVLVWVCVYYYYSTPGKRIMWLIPLLVLLLTMHILSSRTGLLGFYVSVAVFIVFRMFKSRNSNSWKWVIPALLFPVLAVLLLPSLQRKWENSREDLNALLKGGKDMNYKSLAMRVESWRAGWELISSSPWLGVGDAHYDEEIENAYRRIQTPLIPENRIPPHNQFMESWGRNGLLALCCSLYLFIWPLFAGILHREPFRLALWAVFIFAFLLESVLQRQMGILLFTVFYLFLVYLPSFSDRKKTIDIGQGQLF